MVEIRFQPTMHSGPHRLNKQYSVELESRETGIPGVIQVEVIWSPHVPPRREQALLMRRPAYTTALAVFAAEVKGGTDAR